MTHINSIPRPLIGVLCLGIIALCWASSGLHQPLWLDELHSAWVIADGWSELLDRAQQGNQTPGYFVGLKFLINLVGDSPAWVLRLPSVLAWSASIASLTWMALGLDGWHKSSRQLTLGNIVGYLAVLLWCSSVLLDAWQYFYAVEARAYGVVQLLNLWAWYLAIWLITNHRSDSNRTAPTASTPIETPTITTPSTTAVSTESGVPWMWLAWALMATATMHLHITSILSIVFQSGLLILFCISAGRHRAYVIVSQAFVGANALWLLYQSQAVWQRRQQWTNFAGDGSLQSLLEVLPLSAIFLPLMVGTLIGLAVQWYQAKDMLRPNHADSPTNTVWTPWKSCTVRTPWSTWKNWHYTWLWGIAAGGPYLLAWLFTRCEIAPMFHYRFVIVSALPLYLFAASWWLSISMRAMRYVIVASVFVWMNVTSGPLAPQQQSRWQNERREDWQSACAFVHENSRSDSQSLWCYAGLIEGLGMQLPLNASTDEYLSYPLRAGLRLIDSDVPVAVHGLVADRKLWLEQIHQQNSISSNIAAAQRTNPRDIWIVYRGSAERLASDLKTAGLDQFPQVIPIRQFGRVSVARLSLE